MNSLNICVIELDPSVLEVKKFREANPLYIPGKPCVYVGMTGHNPEKRFQQHKAGYKANRFARDYGLYLKPRQYHTHNPMTFDEAKEMEVEKARRLRKRGWAVCQN